MCKTSGANKALLKGLFATTNHEDDKDGSEVVTMKRNIHHNQARVRS